MTDRSVSFDVSTSKADLAGNLQEVVSDFINALDRRPAACTTKITSGPDRALPGAPAAELTIQVFFPEID